jgi:hypothetical protein
MKTARPTAIFYLIVMFFVPLTLAQFSPESHYKNGETTRTILVGFWGHDDCIAARNVDYFAVDAVPCVGI